MIDNLSWVAAYPEILLLAMACLIALVDLAVKTPLRGATYLLTLLTLGGVALLTGVYASSGQVLVGFGGMVISDPMGNWLKCFASLAMMVTLVYGPWLRRCTRHAARRRTVHPGDVSPCWACSS